MPTSCGTGNGPVIVCLVRPSSAYVQRTSQPGAPRVSWPPCLGLSCDPAVTQYPLISR
jgi:hypothetical protein